MPARITVTGGAGFIGSHLCGALGGREVTVYDIAGPGGDILDEKSLSAAVSGRDAVVHLAAVSDVPAAEADPEGARRTNVDGTASVVRACEAAGVGALVFASSAAVYGETAESASEGDALRPVSAYGRTKAEGERLVLGSAVPKKVVLRIFNAYGPGGRGVVSKFAAAAASGGRPLLRGDGSQTRDFVHVRDVAACMAYMAGPGPGGTYNLATGVSTSVGELLGYFAGSGIGEPERAPAGAGDVRASGASAARLAEAGFVAGIGLREGVRQMLGPVPDQVGHGEQQYGRDQQYGAKQEQHDGGH